MLLDEPFGALDPLTRDRLQQSFHRLQKQLRLTVIFVTHDMAEALSLADRIAARPEGMRRPHYSVTTYEYAEPYIERVKKGETTALFASERVLMFALTSGTTNARDHNLYVRGDHAYQSNYAAGLRIGREQLVIFCTTLIAVFAIWIAPEKLFEDYRSHWLFSNPITGTVTTSLDREHRYAFNNRAYEEWFGLKSDALRGRHLREMLRIYCKGLPRPRTNAFSPSSPRRQLRRRSVPRFRRSNGRLGDIGRSVES